MKQQVFHSNFGCQLYSTGKIKTSKKDDGIYGFSTEFELCLNEHVITTFIIVVKFPCSAWQYFPFNKCLDKLQPGFTCSLSSFKVFQEFAPSLTTPLVFPFLANCFNWFFFTQNHQFLAVAIQSIAEKFHSLWESPVSFWQSSWKKPALQGNQGFKAKFRGTYTLLWLRSCILMYVEPSSSTGYYFLYFITVK